MSHKTLVNGTVYEVDGGKTLIDGVAYSIDKGKTLIDGTAYEVGFVREPVPTAMVYSDGTLVFQMGEDVDSSHGTLLASYTNFDTVGYDSEELVPWYSHRNSIKTVSFKDKIQPVATTWWFYDFSSLSNIDIKNLDTSNVTDMRGMFRGCQALTSLDLSSFNTSKVTKMNVMFSGCRALTSLDLSSFNTSNVTAISGMFKGCQALTSLDLSSFNTSNVTAMQSMFYVCSNLTTIYASELWSTVKVTQSWAGESMFTSCNKLVGAIKYISSRTNHTYANYTTGYFTYKAKP